MAESGLDSAEDEADRLDDEIEILEIVGLDEDSPAAGVRVAPEAPEEDESDRDLVIDLDDERSIVAPHDVADPTVTTDDERFARLSADFDNLQKRVSRERLAHERHAAAQVVVRLLPVLDNFERALGAARDAGTEPTFCEGVAMIFRQLLDELRKEGLVAVDTVGEPFNPEFHEAVATTEDDHLPPNTIVEELQRGYLLHDRLLRPALVKVTVDLPDPARSTHDVEEI